MIQGPLRFPCLCISSHGMSQAMCHHTPNQVLMLIEPPSQLLPLRKFLGGTRQAKCVLVAAAQYTLQPCLVDVHSWVAPPTLTVLFLKDQDHVSLLQCDLIGLLGKVCLGDLHLGQL